MNQAKGKRVSREELYQQVWQIPMSKLAAQYGISGNGLAKICRKLKIPYPGRGYWARKAAGKHVIQYQLQPPDADTPTVITITPYEAKTANQPSEATQQALSAQHKAIATITVPDRPTAPHPIIRQWTQEHKEQKRQAREERRREEVRHQRWLAEQIRKKHENLWRQFLEVAQRWQQTRQAWAFNMTLEAKIDDAEREAGKSSLMHECNGRVTGRTDTIHSRVKSIHCLHK